MSPEPSSRPTYRTMIAYLVIAFAASVATTSGVEVANFAIAVLIGLPSYGVAWVLCALIDRFTRQR